MRSYAQNFEDVMLERVFKSKEKGFYIDVGAADSMISSVTLHFYNRGWNGINLEPQPHLAAKLKEARPRDITLQMAMSDRVGTATFHHVDVGGNSGLSSLDGNGPEVKSRPHFTYDVQVSTLRQVCEEHCRGKTIDFLKIDVEGFERQVIEGADWDVYRPTVLCIEVTVPCTQIPAWYEWEPYLLNRRYQFVYFDGLSRFYLAHEHRYHMGHFALPPNVWDQIVR